MHKTKLATVSRLAALALAGLLGFAGAARAEDYGVFCANGRITIDSRSEAEMKSQRGACQFARFPDRSGAESFARKNFSGAGATCSCR